MARRRHINADSGKPRLRAAIDAGTEPLRTIAWAFEERLLWRGVDLLRRVAEAARWPLERLGWLLERRLIWPLQELSAGWGPGGRTIGAGALATVAVLVAVLGGISLSGDDAEPPAEVASPARLAAGVEPAPLPADRSGTPVLHGVPPSFEVDERVRVAAKTGAPVEADTPVTAPLAATGEEAAATSSRKRPVPAGPAAMKVARRFAEAFVFYEVGERPGRTRTVFEETSTSQLATALSERPPRQPAGVEVPQARVLNLVPGPRRGRTFTVSASLLRVGTTSELRLEMRKANGSWRITDVRG